MDKFLDKTKRVIFARQGGMFSSALILSVMIVISSIFGFLRYRILAGFFSKEELDIYFASFRIPDLVFEILITGALTSSFIPIYIRFQKSKDELGENISSIINLISLFLFAFVILVFIFMDKIIFLITPGFDVAKTEAIVYYSRLLLIGQLPFMVFGNFLTGIGQANKIFLVTSLAPIVYNLAVIVSTIFFAKHLFLMAPIIGIILGAVLFFLIQLPLLFKSEFRYRPIIRITSGVKDFFRMVVPRVFTVLASQLDATIDLTLTTLLQAGAYTVFYLAQRLQLLPVSVIGIAFGQASLPYLSEICEAKRVDEFKRVIVDSVLNLFFLSIPLMSFFIFARTPLIRLFFGGQKFDWEATVMTAVTLSYFSLSLPFHTIYYFLTRCFYALLDSRTPFIISFFSILLNAGLSFIFVLVLKLPVWSLALAFSASIIVNTLLLFFILHRKTLGLDLRLMFVETAKISLATIIASVFVYYLMKLLDGLVYDTSRTINVFFLLLTGALTYFLLYLFLAWVFEIKEIYLISKMLIKAKEYRRKILEIYVSYE
jgi:putative peptidoglycan lipid II flippase